MKFSKINTLLFGAALTFAISSCEQEAETDSILTRFAEYSAALTATPVTANECGNVYTLTFALNDKQNTDLTLVVEAGESTTATEGVDFELLTHEIEIPAYAGQDGFTVDIAVLQDFELEQGGNEAIYLTFHTETPSGITKEDVLVAEIEDSGIDVASGETADFALNWAYSDGIGDACGFDLDMTFQTAGTNPYDDDLLGYAASTLACGEEGTLTVEDMNEGEVYDIWVFIYAGEAVPRDMTITIDYARENSTLEGTLTVDGVFDSGMASDGFVVGTIEKNCNVVTIKDPGGNVVAEGRVKGGALRSAHNVHRPF